MSKDSASTRIPRFDGASRIPQPGSISGVKVIGPNVPPETSAFIRPKQPVSLRTPLLESQNALVKSSSGDRLNSAMNAVSKRTTTAFKKIFSKSTKTPTKPIQLRKTTVLDNKNSIKKLIPPTQALPIDTVNKNENITTSRTPSSNTDETAELNQLVTRSSTFVRSGSEQNMSNQVQSSRLPTTVKNYFQTPANVTETIQKNEGFSVLPTMRRNGPLDQMNYTQNNKNITQTISTTMTYNTQELQFQESMPMNETKTLTLNNAKSRGNVNEMPTFSMANPKSLELLSPMTNVTYSNPGSTDNLMNLEDESMPSGLDLDTTLQAAASLMDVQCEELNDSLPLLAPDKMQMKLPLNSTMNTDEHLIDLTTNEFNFTKNMLYSPRHSFPMKNSSKLLYMSSSSAITTPDRPQKLMKLDNSIKKNIGYQNNEQAQNIFSSLLLKGAQSDLLLPIRTPDAEHQAKPTGTKYTEKFCTTQKVEKCVNQAMSLQDINKPTKSKSRCAFDLDLQESSLELINISLSSTALSETNFTANSIGIVNNCSKKLKSNFNMTQSPSLQLLQGLKKQNSFELDESLGILTPDQMKGFLDSTATSQTNNLELPLNSNANNKLSLHQMRMEQTPSPEELPLDPVEVKTDISEFVSQQQALQQRQHLTQAQQQTQDSISQHTEADCSKSEQMIRSNVSKISTSFITSVTSVTSLDTGYQGDGEMSRPASRGASDHSPSNGPVTRKTGPVSRQPSFNQMQQMPPPIRRQDLMTDSDFFTESEADDLHHRGGDRRAQVIDGQLYGPTLVQSSASVLITEHPHMEDSCMESSGVFTDVENRCEEDLSIMRRSQQQAIQELSPDGEGDDSTETVKSNCTQQARLFSHNHTALGQGQLTDAIIQKQNLSLPESCSNDRLSTDTTLSNRTSYCSVEGTNCKSFCSLEETAFNYECGKSLQQLEKNELTTGTQSFFSDQLAKQSYNQAVDNLNSPRKHASLTSLTLSENTQTAYFANKSAIKSASGTAIYEQISGSCADTICKSPDSAEIINKVTNITPKLKNKSAKILSNSPKALGSRTKSNVPNKWEAVMNKIATNKATQVRKNYNDVKSRVSTRNVLVNPGISGENSSPASSLASPRTRRSPTATSSSVLKVLQTNSPKFREANNNNANVLKTKHVPLQNATKRVRSYSKDSQKSSQSDLSLVSGSPKLLAKTPIRAAKKRDVRNLSISPTDLGPPPKTLNGNDVRSKTVPATVSQQQKRLSASSTTTNASNTLSNTATPTQPTSTSNTPTLATINGGVGKSMPAKKQSVTLRRLETKPLTKSTKDHSRVLGNNQQINATSTTTQTTVNNGGSKVAAVSDMLDINLNNNNNNKNNNVQITTTTQATANGDKLQLRTNSQSSSPILSEKHKTPTTTNATKKLQHTVEKKPQMKLQTTRKFLLSNKHAAGSGAGTPTDSSAKLISTTTTADTTPTSTAGYVEDEDFQQFKLLNHYSCNGRLDYDSLERHLAEYYAKKEHQENSVTALGVLLNYLVQDLDAFACPAMKSENINMKEQLTEVLRKLNDIRDDNAELQHQLCEKESYYIQREEELQQLHRCELQKSIENGKEIEMLANKRIQELEAKLADKDEQHKHLMHDYRYEMELKFAEKQQQLISLEQKLQAANIKEKELTDKILTMENQYLQELQAAETRENKLNESVNNLKTELDKVSEIKQNRERELRDKLNLSNDEIAILRSTPRTNGESSISLSSPSMRHSSASCRASTLSELSRLQNETESLRCVLELKQKEISKLNKQNEELMRDAEERSMLRGKIHSLESHKEMLQSELDIKTEKEKEYLRQIDEMQKKLKYESQKQTRLSLDNEALSWQLKQRSEQLHLIHSKLHESLKDSSSSGVEWSSMVNKSFNRNSTSISEQGSPPASPSMKGFIEKSDSVSWVLEMDDETPEAAASKLVRRVGSFRSGERSPSIRRNYSVSNNATTFAPQTKSSLGPNPLSQSMSATSVIRQHSTDATTAHNSSLSARIRSQSVSSSKYLETAETKPNSSKKLARKKSIGSNSKPEKSQIMRPRTSTLKTAEQAEELLKFRRASSGEAGNQNLKLITCDSSSLNCGERLEIHSIPKATGNVLKGRKKCLEIQESAGEAMVSGTNSEDEGCSASSDEIATSESTGSGTSNSSMSLNHMKNSNMSLEDVLLLEKINSLNGTPMECSWSDDADVYGENSTV